MVLLGDTTQTDTKIKSLDLCYSFCFIPKNLGAMINFQLIYWSKPIRFMRFSFIRGGGGRVLPYIGYIYECEYK